jgi:hypothetical protein
MNEQTVNIIQQPAAVNEQTVNIIQQPAAVNEQAVNIFKQPAAVNELNMNNIQPPAAVKEPKVEKKRKDVVEECHLPKCSREVIGDCKVCNKGTCKRHLLPCVHCVAGVCKEHIKEHEKKCALNPKVVEAREKKEKDAKEAKELVEKLKAKLAGLVAKRSTAPKGAKGGAK